MDLEEALVYWINANISDNINDLSQVVHLGILCELISAAKPDAINMADVSLEGKTWAEKGKLLKEYLQQLDEFYINELGVLRQTVVERIKITRIARNGDTKEILKLMELIVGAVISCENKKLYIDRLMTLDEMIQACLMPFMASIIEKIENKGTGEEKRVKQTLVQQNIALDNELETTQVELAGTEEVNSQLKLEIEDLRTQIFELETTRELYEVPKVQQVAPETNEDELNQLRKENSDLESSSQALSDKLKFRDGEIAKLKDEIDLMQEKLVTLEKTESQLELYKRKVIDSGSMSIKNRELQNINRQLKEKLQKQEEETGKFGNIQQALDFYKDSLGEEKENVARLTVQNQDLSRRLDEVNAKNDEMSEKCSRFEQKVKQLQNKLEFQQFDSENVGSLDMDMSLGSMEYEERIRKLEEENNSLRGQGSDMLVTELNSQVEKLLISKSQSEFSMMEERNQLIDSVKEHSAAINTLQSRLNNLNAELIIKQTQNTAYLDKIEILEKDNNRLEKLVVDMDSLRSEATALRQEIAEAYKTNNELNQAVVQAKDESFALVTSRSVALADSKSVEDANFEQQASDLKIKDLKIAVKNSKQQLHLANLESERLKSQVNQTPSDNEVITRLLDDIKSLEKRLADKEEENTYLIETKDKLNSNWNSELRDFETELQRLVLESSS